MKHRILTLCIASLLAFAVSYVWQLRTIPQPDWSDNEIAVLQSLSLAALPPLDEDPSNSVADSPQAAEFGARLFMDARLSANGGISCATCHQPIRRFTDGLQKGQAIGTSQRNTPSIVGVAYSPWMYWDGRRDSLWAQALSPLEDVSEHATDRRQVVNLISSDEEYRSRYASIFGAFPELTNSEAITHVFVNVGKAIAAFERTLMPSPSRFDDYVAAVQSGDVKRQKEIFSDDEAWGLRHFIGAANCTQCHNGPLLTNNEFHNTGVINFPGETPDKGRIDGVRLVQSSEFNCLSDYSDDLEKRCAELQFARTGAELIGAIRVPSLRNLENTQPYMSKGQLPTLTEVLLHYNAAPEAMIGHNEAKPLGLSQRELSQLESFLLTLASPLATRDSL